MAEYFKTRLKKGVNLILLSIDVAYFIFGHTWLL